MKKTKKSVTTFEIVGDIIIIILVIVGIFYRDVIPISKWIYTDTFDYHAYASAYGNITDGETVEVYLSGFAIRYDGKMHYFINAIAIGRDVWDYDSVQIQPGSEVQIVDDDENLWTINIPESETVSPYKRIIVSNLIFIAFICFTIVIVRNDNRKKRQRA